MKTKSALSYFGSDSEVAGELAAMLDHCRHVTIPFVGGASILPHLKARAIVGNDKNRQAINFFRQMSDDQNKHEVIRLCRRTLSHPSEIEDAQAIVESQRAETALDAWAYWAVCWIGRKGKGGTVNEGGVPSIRWAADGGNNASRIKAAAEDLEKWSEHFRDCEWTQTDFREVLLKVKDRNDCGVYCDPPWIGAGDSYRYSFVRRDHEDLYSLVNEYDNATVALRNGDDPFIRSLYCGWNIIEASSRTQSNSVKGEIWITNK